VSETTRLQGPDEAAIRETDTGKLVDGAGWFVLNLREASWDHDPDAGTWCGFESDDAHFPQYGVNVHVVMPGQANGRYHAETNQEDFLVLAGECIAIVEGEERHLRQWDFFHCPPGTHHIIVGAGDGPCAILMIGTRDPDRTIEYPVDEVAARYGAAVSEPTNSPREAYAGQRRETTRVPAPWPT
jgi:uncharacterized cupin superfamily protein